MKFSYKDIILLTILFLVAFFVWTQPLHDNQGPFGEGDSAWHFANGDPQFQMDRSTTQMPHFISVWYYNISRLGPDALEYPPPNHLNYALMQIGGGERILSPFIYIAITCALGVFATFFLVRRLFGTWQAFIAGFGLIFSLREVMLYLWGQRPTMVSFVFIPMILYCLYMYFHGYYEHKEKNIYLYLLVLLVGGQFLLHIQGSVVTFLVAVGFLGLMLIKHRKLPVSKRNIKQVGIAVVVLLVLIVPFAPIYWGLELGEASGEKAPLSYLFKWAPPSNTFQGSYPPSYADTLNHYPWMLLLFVVLGLGIALYRRKDRDLLLLGWLFGIYIAFHFNVFLGTSGPRIVRMLVAEPPLFFALIGVGLIGGVGMLPIKKQFKGWAKIIVTILFVVLILQVKAPEVNQTLSSAYGGLGRLTPQQIEAANWILNSDIPEGAFIYNEGTITFPKARWFLALSNRHVAQWYGARRNLSTIPYDPGEEYFIFDYSDLAYLQDNPQYAAEIKKAQDLEEHNFKGVRPLYNANNIRIYKVEGTLEAPP